MDVSVERIVLDSSQAYDAMTPDDTRPAETAILLGNGHNLSPCESIMDG